MLKIDKEEMSEKLKNRDEFSNFKIWIYWFSEFR